MIFFSPPHGGLSLRNPACLRDAFGNLDLTGTWTYATRSHIHPICPCLFLILLPLDVSLGQIFDCKLFGVGNISCVLVSVTSQACTLLELSKSNNHCAGNMLHAFPALAFTCFTESLPAFMVGWENPLGYNVSQTSMANG